jgi:hypothetical protein
MNKTGSLIKYFCSAVLLISVISCTDCKSISYPSLTFNPSDLNLIPYQGDEQLLFTDSLNDSIPYRGDGRYLHQEHIYLPNKCTNDGIDYFSQTAGCSFSDTSKRSYIDLYLGLYYDNDFKSVKKRFRIYLRVPFDKNIKGFTEIYDFTGDSILPATYVSFAKNLQIASLTFTSVYILQSSISKVEDEYILFVYYTISEGIVAFETNKKHLWVMDNNYKNQGSNIISYSPKLQVLTVQTNIIITG